MDSNTRCSPNLQQLTANDPTCSVNMLETTSVEVSGDITTEKKSGWERLANELKLDIFDRVVIADGRSEYKYMFFSESDNQPWGYNRRVRYMFVKLPWTLRGITKGDSIIYEDRIIEAIVGKPLTLLTCMRNPTSVNWEQTFRERDELLCRPVTYQPSMSSIQVMGSTCGLMIASAYEAFKARNKSAKSLLSVDRMRLESIVNETRARMGQGSHFSADLYCSPRRDEYSVFEAYLWYAFVHLCVQQVIRVGLGVGEIEMADHPGLIALIRDLRYFADNNVVKIRVRVLWNRYYPEEQWRTWLPAVGGKIIWVFDNSAMEHPQMAT